MADQNQKELPKYECHKVVHALEIENVERHNDGSATIVPLDKNYAPFLVDAAYVAKHQPKINGYFVVYKDGYRSWSPKEAFESGYSLIKE